MEVEGSTTSIVRESLACSGCGATLHFIPGTHQLACDHCGNVNEINVANKYLKSFDFNAFVSKTQSVPSPLPIQQVICNGCGSKTVLDQNVIASNCPFCTSPLCLDLNNKDTYVRPHYILPFSLNKEKAVQSFLEWSNHLSIFKPGNLIQSIRNSSSTPLQGLYLPYWILTLN